MAFLLPSSVLGIYHSAKSAKKQEGICFSPAFSADSVVVLRFHVLQITFEFALDALEGVVDALDVATQVVRDFLIAFPVQIRSQHFLF